MREQVGGERVAPVKRLWSWGRMPGMAETVDDLDALLDATLGRVELPVTDEEEPWKD